jgi:hypothetical protein
MGGAGIGFASLKRSLGYAVISYAGMGKVIGFASLNFVVIGCASLKRSLAAP